MKLELKYRHKGHTVKIFSNGHGYSSHVYYFPENSKCDHRIFQKNFFSCLEAAIEHSDTWIDELTTDY